jgi:aryl-alcohol dehydrogenase-like predicted oxidoreductase
MATPSTFARDLGNAWPTYVHEWDARLRARDGRSLAELAVDYTVSRTVASGVVVGAASVAEVAMATRAWRGVELREWEVVGGEGVGWME